MSAGDYETPASVTSERAVIGAIIVSGGDALDEITLEVDDFLVTTNALIFERLVAMRAAGQYIDQFTVVDRMPPQHQAAVYDVAGSVFTAANVGYYAEIVAEASLRRKVAAAAAAIAEMAPVADAVTLLDDARTALDGVASLDLHTAVPTMGESFDEILALMAEEVENVPTPWSRLNASLGGGLRRGGFYVIGARPGHGKSAIALQLAFEMGRRGKVLFASLEMPRQEVHLRVIAQQNRIPFKALLDNKLSDFMVERMNAWRGVTPLNIAVDDRAGATVYDIRNRARTMHRQAPLGGVVVDYLQLMNDPRNLPRHEKVAEMTRALKLLSRELNVPVIACSQLNRESTKRSDGRPSLSDLRESGSIEQDADVVMLLDRVANDAGEMGDELGLFLAKNRQGQTGVSFLSWQGEFVRAMEA